MTKEKLIEIQKLAKDLMEKGNDTQHGFDHVERTVDNALAIVKLLEIKNVDLNLLQAACYLHDVPINLFHHDPVIKHWLENYAVIKYMPEILKKLKISGVEYDILLNAIRRHTFTIPYRRLNRNGDIYLKIMQDADSIDFFSRQREMSLSKSKMKFLSYYFADVIGKYLFIDGRNHLEKYLNFPELAKYDWYGNN